MGKAELLRAFDEISFGRDRTLNLRDSYPTAPEARQRAEAWLRQRQVTSREKVVIITGRGKGSPGGIPVVKEEVVALLHSLRRLGVVKGWSENTQGSFVVEPAAMQELLSAPLRRRGAGKRDTIASEDSLNAFAGLSRTTVGLLRTLAERSLQDLGIKDIDGLIQAEMGRKLSILSRAIPESGDREAALRAVIIRATEELDAGNG